MLRKLIFAAGLMAAATLVDADSAVIPVGNFNVGQPNEFTEAIEASSVGVESDGRYFAVALESYKVPQHADGTDDSYNLHISSVRFSCKKPVLYTYRQTFFLGAKMLYDTGNKAKPIVTKLEPSSPGMGVISAVCAGVAMSETHQ